VDREQVQDSRGAGAGGDQAEMAGTTNTNALVPGRVDNREDAVANSFRSRSREEHQQQQQQQQQQQRGRPQHRGGGHQQQRGGSSRVRLLRTRSTPKPPSATAPEPASPGFYPAGGGGGGLEDIVSPIESFLELTAHTLSQHSQQQLHSTTAGSTTTTGFSHPALRQEQTQPGHAPPVTRGAGGGFSPRSESEQSRSMASDLSWDIVSRVNSQSDTDSEYTFHSYTTDASATGSVSGSSWENGSTGGSSSSVISNRSKSTNTSRNSSRQTTPPNTNGSRAHTPPFAGGHTPRGGPYSSPGLMGGSSSVGPGTYRANTPLSPKEHDKRREDSGAVGLDDLVGFSDLLYPTGSSGDEHGDGHLDTEKAAPPPRRTSFASCWRWCSFKLWCFVLGSVYWSLVDLWNEGRVRRRRKEKRDPSDDDARNKRGTDVPAGRPTAVSTLNPRRRPGRKAHPQAEAASPPALPASGPAELATAALSNQPAPPSTPRPSSGLFTTKFAVAPAPPLALSPLVATTMGGALPAQQRGEGKEEGAQSGAGSGLPGAGTPFAQQEKEETVLATDQRPAQTRVELKKPFEASL